MQKRRVFLPGYRCSVTRNWRSAYEGSSRLRSNEVPVGTLSDGTVLHQQDGGTKSRQVPIWEKSNLTLEEAAAYSGIGINKLRSLSDKEHCQFVLWVGSKRLIKRRKLDEYTERMYSL